MAGVVLSQGQPGLGWRLGFSLPGPVQFPSSAMRIGILVEDVLGLISDVCCGHRGVLSLVWGDLPVLTALLQES